MRKFTLYLVYAISIFIFNQCSQHDEARSKVKIGLIGPITGDGASYGASMVRGAELVFKNDSTFRLIIEDSKLSAKDGINAFNKLVNSDRVKIIFGAAASSVSLALAPQANSKQVILFSSISTADDLSHAGDYFFRNVPKNNVQGKTASEFLAKNLGLTKVAILSNNNDYGVSISGGFREASATNGLQIIFDESYNDGSKDFKATLTKLKSIRPEAIFIPGYYQESTIILKQAREVGLETIFFGGDGSYSDELIQNAGEASEGFYCTIMNIDEEADYYKTFYKAFKTTYDREPDVYDAYAYEACMILKEAVGSVGNEPNKIREYLLTSKFNSLTGEISFESNGDVSRLFKVVRVNNGGFE